MFCGRWEFQWSFEFCSKAKNAFIVETYICVKVLYIRFIHSLLILVLSSLYVWGMMWRCFSFWNEDKIWNDVCKIRSPYHINKYKSLVDVVFLCAEDMNIIFCIKWILVTHGLRIVIIVRIWKKRHITRAGKVQKIWVRNLWSLDLVGHEREKLIEKVFENLN